MNAHRRHSLWLVALACLALAACGSDEYDAAPAGNREPADEAVRPLYTDPFDAEVTRIQLEAGSEYDASADEVRIFAVVRDQLGRSLVDVDFNTYNFAVELQPTRAGDKVPTEELTLTRETSSDAIVALVIDSSGSMEATTETGQTRMTVAKESAKFFVDLMGPGDRTAVVDFDDDARTVQQLTSDPAALRSAIDTFAASGATNLGAALGEAVRAAGNRPGKRAAILLTDGDDTVDSVTGGPDAWFNNAQSARWNALVLAQQNELKVFTVALGTGISDVGLADLAFIAQETGGQFFEAPSAASLETVFRTTIPREIEALPPVETFVLTFPNRTPPLNRPVDVDFRLSLLYENANGALFDKASGTYTVVP